MEDSVAQGLANKIYERRKTAAYDLERIVKQENDPARIRAIVSQLCTEFIGDSKRTARSPSGGLIGLAAATIALGRASAQYLDLIVPADSRIRYYSTESLYNIAKVAKGEILLYFNEIFDALCKLSADSETSVKNGSELLDRLMKDIVSEKASNYVSILHNHRLDNDIEDSESQELDAEDDASLRTTAFSLERFIPLLSERLYVINPYTRTFLVSWLAVLNSIPDLDLIRFLPEFIDGLMTFLADTHQDVRVATSRLLDAFLDELKTTLVAEDTQAMMSPQISTVSPATTTSIEKIAKPSDSSAAAYAENAVPPAFDAYVDFPKLISVLHTHLRSSEEAIQLTALRWFSEFFTICPGSLLSFTPRLITLVLPAISHESTALRRAARDVNEKLLEMIRSSMNTELRDRGISMPHRQTPALDFTSTVNSATGQLANENEETRTAALGWLMEMHKMTSSKLTASVTEDSLRKVKVTTEILPALLGALSDTSESVVKKDLELLAQISKNDDYFNQLMVDLLSLFASDRNLLESRGALIIRQLSLNLNGERIYRTLAENLERETDIEFAQTMVHHLNSSLLTSPELLDARRRLRQVHTAEGSTFFTSLYKSWCHNAVATFSLCLLAQAYEQAANLLQIFGDLEITVQMLVHIDKLVYLLESPVFTYLRLQLLEPERYPSLTFHTLRNRLNSIMPIGYVTQGQAKTAAASTRGKPNHEPNWAELLAKFRAVQGRRSTSMNRRLILDKLEKRDNI